MSTLCAVRIDFMAHIFIQSFMTWRTLITKRNLEGIISRELDRQQTVHAHNIYGTSSQYMFSYMELNFRIYYARNDNKFLWRVYL